MDRPITDPDMVMGCFGGNKQDAEDEKWRKEANKRIEKQLQRDKQVYRATHRLLLLGTYGRATS